MLSKATIADIPTLNFLVNSAYRGESSEKGWTTESHLLGGVRSTEEGLLETMQQSNVNILKFTTDGQIIGCVMLEQKPEKLYLGMLTVSPTLQGGGIGKQMLNAAVYEAKRLKLPKIGITVVSVRAELIAWYERHGYVATGQTEPFPMDDQKFGLPKQFLEFIVMERLV